MTHVGSKSEGTGEPMQSNEASGGHSIRVFVSYSRSDVSFTDQLVLALKDKGYSPVLDRSDIDAAEKWKERLQGLIVGSDRAVFVVSDASVASPICAWELEEIARHGKRLFPIYPAPLAVESPQGLADLNRIHFYAEPSVPGSGFYDGVQKLDRAMRQDTEWLRLQTRLIERSEEWLVAKAPELLLRGSALEQAIEWAKRAPAGTLISNSLAEYLSASQVAEHEIKNRDLRRESEVTEYRDLLGQVQTIIGRIPETPPDFAQMLPQLTALVREERRRNAKFRLFVTIYLAALTAAIVALSAAMYFLNVLS